MNIQLIKGRFDTSDAKELLTKMVHAKIKFIENKITDSNHQNEEDIKMREKRIIELQNELKLLLSNINQLEKNVVISGSISIDA